MLRCCTAGKEGLFEGGKLVEGIEGAARLVVEEAGVVPPGAEVSGAALGVGLGVPPVDAVHLGVFLQQGDEVGGELPLSGVAVGVGG